MTGKIEYDDDEFQFRMRRLAKENAEMVSRAMLKGVYYLIQNMPPYPPEKPSSDRTFTLERTMSGVVGVGGDVNTLSTVTREGADVVGLLGTRLEYAPFVIDRDKQAWMHQGFWWILQEYVEDNFDNTVEVIIGELDKQI